MKLTTGQTTVKTTPLAGGCIGSSFCIETERGNRYFLKRYSRPGVAEAEAAGLKELSKAQKVNTPQVLAATHDELLLNYIDSAGKREDFQTLLGEQLAALHAVKGREFGFERDNFIGESVQVNRKCDSWNRFYIEHRLRYQLQLAKRNGSCTTELKKLSSELIAIIPNILKGSEEEPCLLHGDLWGGNVMTDESGEPVLIDPAVYYGHRETDIAMTTLFGGFSEEFYRSYNRHYPLKKGWESRLNLYKLYHILNHMNLFGNSYYSQAISLMKSYL